MPRKQRPSGSAGFTLPPRNTRPRLRATKGSLTSYTSVYNDFANPDALIRWVATILNSLSEEDASITKVTVSSLDVQGTTQRHIAYIWYPVH
jgi:hypothetical protein